MLCEIHGIKQWPNALAMIGLIIIIIASIVGRPIFNVATVSGYIGGFVIAIVFNTYGIDTGGGRINNGWII